MRAAHWITHLDYDWQSPVWRHWLVGLARGRQFIRYDERGCGLSAHDVDDFSLDAFVQDLEAVVDDLGLERFPLLGVSQGGAMAITYAARHPERVSHLILLGAYAQGRLRRPVTDEQRREAALQFEIVRLGWGREDPAFRRFFTSTFIPDAPPDLWESFAELLRRTTSAENAAQMLETWAMIDVTEARPASKHPPCSCTHGTSSASRQNEPISWPRSSRARFVPLDSRNHLMRPAEPAWAQFLAEVDQFLELSPPLSGGLPAGSSSRRASSSTSSVMAELSRSSSSGISASVQRMPAIVSTTSKKGNETWLRVSWYSLNAGLAGTGGGRRAARARARHHEAHR